MQPFTYDEYRYILTSLREKGYVFVNYREGFNLQSYPPSCRLPFVTWPFAIIRHDVDLSLQKAVEMAQIEHEMGVKAVYFLMTTSEAYNIRSQRSLLAVRKLRDLGHEIGIHFDANIYKKNARGIRKAFSADLRLLEDLTGKISSDPYVTYHMPSGDEKPSFGCQVDREPFLTKIKYLSDSYGEWRFGHPLNSKQFQEGKPLHLSFHPIWWTKGYLFLGISFPSAIIENFKQDQGEVLNQWIDRNIWGGN